MPQTEVTGEFVLPQRPQFEAHEIYEEVIAGSAATSELVRAGMLVPDQEAQTGPVPLGRLRLEEALRRALDPVPDEALVWQYVHDEDQRLISVLDSPGLDPNGDHHIIALSATRIDRRNLRTVSHTFVIEGDLDRWA